ncbi:B-cell receptor CD22-like [Mugil cephalus]|uniref:B-cell receptor CD22-like n=1 Tax=Mugil cephalus TaxID=48193 RepID=UPI001FB75D5D|nr:B-cell receptor CD22-like [Mugil cephalus]
MIVALLLVIMESAGTASTSWNVTFENADYCVSEGSSVEFRCSYFYPDGNTIRSTQWDKGDYKNGRWQRVKLSDLPSYENRSAYLGDHQHNCSLAIYNLQETDTGHYYFRFDTDTYGLRSKDSVHLSVTELKASVSPRRVTAGNNVTLECKTSCQIHSLVWIKDGHPVAKSKFQARLEDSGSYVCAVEGHESAHSNAVTLDVWYSPLNVSVEVSHADPLTVGSSVNLTCSSAANPAADSYTWYRGTVSSSMLRVGSGQVLLIPAMETSDAGLYLCQATNRVGGNNSTEVRLTVETDINRLIFLVGFGVKVVIVLLLSLVIIWAWRRCRMSSTDREVRRSTYNTSEEHYHDYENFQVLNT